MKVGQKVRVRSFRDSVSKDIATKVGAVGVVQAEKILDGGKMGFVVSFTDNVSTWFYREELEVVL